ncbi:hypothetical protein POM88_004618 [Heracleum sosnowskyi]|uniref:Uncharacterized protein n=1 Tax=Heracleum sosnowskyi TaxID=360622 RepID=A0AAD8JKN9_9APIA|nr:hypothetical protein POM88_004618 [Heracleum sosnowskyi]
MELDVYHLQKMSTDYERAKKLAVKEVGDTIDIHDIKHLTENHCLIGDVVGDTSEEWSNQDTTYSELDHSPNQRDDDNCQLEEDGIDDDLAMELEQALTQNEGDSEDELVMELEQTLSDYEGDSED